MWSYPPSLDRSTALPVDEDTQPVLTPSLFSVISFSWDGSEEVLADMLEIVAEEYWGDYVDPSYKYWTPPPT